MEHYETGEACGVNEIGKILVKGDSVMSAYFDDFEATALHMRHGWYDTGDMGYRDEEGYLWHVGRLGRFLKIGGEMVSLGQVEDVLQRTLPDSGGVRRGRGPRRRARRADRRRRHRQGGRDARRSPTLAGKPAADRRAEAVPRGAVPAEDARAARWTTAR